MIERIEYLATVSVARACGFAALAILTFFVGMSADLAVAFKSAGYLALLTSLVLLLKSRLVFRQPYRSTELWLMLKPDERPEAAVAQRIISTVLNAAYLRFATQAAVLAVLFLASGIAFGLLQG